MSTLSVIWQCLCFCQYKYAAFSATLWVAIKYVIDRSLDGVACKNCHLVNIFGNISS